MKTLTKASIVLVGLTVFCACSKVDFGNSPGPSGTASSSSTTANGDGSASGTLTANGNSNTGAAGNGGASNPASSQGPAIKFVGPPCARQSQCLVEFDLTQPMPDQVDFDWRTNDTLYQSTPPAGEVYGQPGVHYVSTGGHITFAPGQTVQKAYVQNINPYSYSILIGVVMSNCAYNGVAESCADDFK